MTSFESTQDGHPAGAQATDENDLEKRGNKLDGAMQEILLPVGGDTGTRSGSSKSTLKDGRSKPSESSSKHSPFECSESTVRDETVYPEGGSRAWAVVFGSCCGMMACFGPMNSIGTFQAYLSTHQLQDQGPSAIGWIFSLYVFLSFFCGIQIGPIFDEKGPRLLVLAGSVLILATMFLVGVCTEYWHFVIVWGVLGGFGTALIFTPAVACIGHYFCVRRATATGIAATGGSLGGIVFPLMLESLIPKIGFAWATRVLGFIFLLLTVIANALIRSRLPPNSRVSFRPDFKIFRDSSFVLTTLGVFLIEWALFVPLSYISSYALDNGIDSTFSYQLLAVLNVGSFFGRWLPGYVADKVGRFNTMIVTVTLCLITTLSLWLPAGGSTAMLVVFAAVYGFASGSNISLTPVCVGQLCDTAEYGRYYATCYTIASFGTLTGIPIAGQILSANDGKYWGLIILTGMCYAGGLAAFIAARIVTVGWRITAVF